MTDKYRSENTQRTLSVLMLMGGHEINGVAPGEIAKALTISPSNITRVLANLEIAGLAETMPETGRWRLTARIVQMAVAHLNALDKAEIKLGETRQRYSRDR